MSRLLIDDLTRLSTPSDFELHLHRPTRPGSRSPAEFTYPCVKRLQFKGHVKFTHLVVLGPLHPEPSGRAEFRQIVELLADRVCLIPNPVPVEVFLPTLPRNLAGVRRDPCPADATDHSFVQWALALYDWCRTQGQVVEADTICIIRDAIRRLRYYIDALDRSAGACSPEGAIPTTGVGPVPTALPATEAAQCAIRSILKMLTNGVSDDRIRQAAVLVDSRTLTTNDKLTGIDDLIPIPATTSAQVLGTMLGVKRQAVTKTVWWVQHRKGKRAEEIERRRERHQERAGRSDLPAADDRPAW